MHVLQSQYPSDQCSVADFKSALLQISHACAAGSVSIRPVQRSRLQIRADKGEEGGPAGRSKQAQAPEAG